MNQNSFYDSVIFNGALVGLSLVLFVATMITFAVRFSVYQALSRAQRRPYNAAFLVALTNLLYVAWFALRQMFSDQQGLQEVSASLSYSVAFPIATMLAVVYFSYCVIGIWRSSLLASVGYRVLYSALGFAGWFMLWFYYYWQLWGFNYYF